MKKKIIIILISMTILLGSTSFVTATIHQENIIPTDQQTPTLITLTENEQTGSFAEDLSGLMLQVTESTVLSYISGLVAFGPRVTGTMACDNAGDYIAGVFSGMGLETKTIPWTSGGYGGNNIEGTHEGASDDSDQIYMICAHYDSVSGSPGADDNAAGTAAVMAAAQVMSQYTFTHEVKFVAFSGEEQGLHGSSRYASNAANNNWNIIEVLNGDMIGYAETVTDQTHVNVLGSGAISGTAQIICDTYPELLDLTVVPGSAGANSDHWPFMQEGYDAAMFHEYKFNTYYHSSQDTIAHMDMNYDMRVTRLMLGTLSYYAGFIPQNPGDDIDLIPPVVTIEKPVENDYVKGMVTVSGRAHDFTSYVKHVLVKINDHEWDYAELTSSESGKVVWNYTFNTHQFEDGPLRISAVALNKKSTQSGVFNIDVMVANTPLTADIIIPNGGITLEELSFSASGVGGAPPYSYFWEFGDDGISELAQPTHVYYHPGEYQVQVTITDMLDQQIQRQGVVTIMPSDENPPTVTISNPENGIYLSNNLIIPFFTPVIIKSVNIIVDAEDDETGIDYVDVFIDAEKQTRLYNAPYEFMYETDGFGQHIIRVEGYDIVGNMESAEQMIWTVF